MNETAKDWSQWDDAYSFVSGNNPNFIANDLPQNTFQRLNLNVIIFINKNGDIIYGKAYDTQNNQYTSLPQNLSSFKNDSPLLQNNNLQGLTGVIDLPEGPMIIVSKPILTSHDQGPVMGTLIIGRYLSQSQLNRFINIPNSTLTVQSYSTANTSPEYQSVIPLLSNTTSSTSKVLGRNSIAAYGLINDIYGNPSIIIRSEMVRTLYNSYLSNVIYFVGAVLLVGILFVILILYFLDKNVMNRLDKLISEIVDIGKKGDISRRVSVKGDDELAELASSINSSLFSLQKYEKDIENSEKKYRNIFENTGTAMIIAEEDLTITLVNRTFENILNLKKHEIIGKNWIEMVVPGHREKIKKYHGLSADMDAGHQLNTYDVEMIIDNKTKYFFATFDFIPGTRKSLISLIDITDRKIAERLLKSSLKEKELLLREIHHRVKNSLQIISSLLSLQASEFDDINVIESYNESENRIHSIALIHESLYNSSDISEINFRKYVETLIENIIFSYNVETERIKIKLELDEFELGIETSIPLGLIINELVSNAVKHAFKDNEGCIKLKLSKVDDEYELIIQDNGIGLSADFDIENTKSLGFLLVNQLVNQLEGNIEIVSIDGLLFKIRFKELEYDKRL